MPDKPPYADEIEVEIDFRMNVGKSPPMRSMVFGHISGNGTVVLECDRVQSFLCPMAK